MKLLHDHRPFKQALHALVDANPDIAREATWADFDSDYAKLCKEHKPRLNSAPLHAALRRLLGDQRPDRAHKLIAAIDDDTASAAGMVVVGGGLILFGFACLVAVVAAAMALVRALGG